MPPDDLRTGPVDRPVRTRRTLAALALRLAAASGVIAALSLCALSVRAPKVAGEAEVQPAVPAASVMVSPGTARLRLAEPGIDPVRVEPGRIDPATGLREDGLARGTFAAPDAPALRLMLTRGAGAHRAPGLFVLLARRAAEGPALAVIRTGGYGRIATKFGAVETLEATLAGPVERACTAFVTREVALRIDGWLCAPLGRPPGRRALACLLDALDLDDPADPVASAAFRASAPRGAGACERPDASADPAARTGSIGKRRPARKSEAKLRQTAQARP